MLRRRKKNTAVQEPEVAAPGLCYAPFASMHLDPQGNVRACCQNTWQKLGNITEEPLLAIWNGEEAERLRARLAADDLSLGCELCAVELDMGADNSAYLRNFEPLRRNGPHPEWPRQLEMALSIACNLQCIMCNGELSSSIRVHREHRPALANPFDDAFFDQLDEFIPHLETVTFLGGEPFMGAEPLRAMEMLIAAGNSPRVHINTNGTQLNSRVRRVLEALPVHLAVSVDGYSREVVEAVRVGADQEKVVAHIDEMRSLLVESDGSMTLTFCMMRQNYWELVDVCEWADDLDVDVTINTVTHPPAASLHHLTEVALSEVIERLESQSSRAARLGRNHDVWLGELERIHSLTQRRATPVELASRPPQPPASPPNALRMRVDGSQVIKKIVSEDSTVLGFDAETLVGQSSDHLRDELIRRHGRLERSTLDFTIPGREERVFVLDGDAAPITFRAGMQPTENGEEWIIWEAPTPD